MPRLLLVDDNPSIHKIAETLLATSPIELVCVHSAAAALAKVESGEHFDVALVDTSMAGMDGWGLLARLRELPSTARMPIAMMAGVLDTVDPERIREAPIQGFLKKPVELRELGDRITRLMETPVPLPEPPAPKASSPFATMPATHLADLPEFRKKQASLVPVEAVETPEKIEEVMETGETGEDVLELTEADLYPEPAAVASPAEPEEVSLDLEELDLENLRELSIPTPTPAPALPLPALEAVSEHAESTPQEGFWPVDDLDAIATLDRLPSPVALEEAPSFPETSLAEVDLPDLGAPTEELMDISSLSNLPEIEEISTTAQAAPPEIPLASLLEEPREEVFFTPPLPPLEESLDWSDESDSLLSAVEAPSPVEAAAIPEEELDLADVSVPEMVPEPGTLQLDLEEALPLLEATASAELPETVSPESAETIVTAALLESAAAPAEVLQVVPTPVPVLNLGTKELLDAMLSDPILMDTLAKAVVARLGDQALREIAWEVIPELAERLPRS